MAAHKGPTSPRPRCTRSGSSVAAIPVYQSNPFFQRKSWISNPGVIARFIAVLETAFHNFFKDVEVTLKSQEIEGWHKTISNTEGPQILGATFQKCIRPWDQAPSWRSLEPHKFMQPISPICNGQAVWPLKMGPISCPETSVTNYQSY
jgi:hypothetical protein